ncbi:UNVERIFIED_CONTAM: hypothetical protein Scaly_2271300 [Sesamum calycinum]|uniref:DUF7705 domain-containing protein n=1 Tax=Sesamum calycinum TaxID=2727403 RepID=A0AAW2MAX2_9LAMI
MLLLLLQELFGIALLSIVLLEFVVSAGQRGTTTSAVGDPGMRRDGLRVAIEAWNQCNEVGEEAPNMGSPRKADCFDIINNSTNPIRLVHRVKEEDNELGILNASTKGPTTIDTNQYAAWKEIYLGRKCQVQDNPKPWQFWMIMIKSGNMDTLAAVCPRNGKKATPFPPEPGFPCFGLGCMNMPLMYHNYTSVREHNGTNTLQGSFYGTWDLDSDVSKALTENDTSYHQLSWEKRSGKGAGLFITF